MRLINVVFLITCVFIFGIFAQEKIEKSNKEKSDTKKNESTVDDKPIIRDIAPPAIDPDLVATSNFQRTNKKYRIGFQDVLTIDVYRHPELSRTVSVGQDGTILLPRIDEPIVAVCKTERELTALITTLYKNYLRNPYVNVRTQEQRSQPFSVIGAVNKPGSFFLNQKIRLLSLVSLAGGPDVEKSGSRIQVARAGNLSACTPSDERDGDIEFLAFSLNDVLSGKENPWMEPGDIVSILEAQEAYVIGDVNEPAKIVLKEDVTLTEAIANAGGVNSTAQLSKVLIQRKEKGNPIRSELVYDLKDIRERKIADPILQANDIVVVNSSTSKKFKKGLWDLVIKGLPNIFYRIPL